jgi:putative membrane protein
VETEVLAHMWHDGWGWGVGGFVMMILMMGLFWAAIVVTIVWGIRQFRPRDVSTPGGSTSAMRVLEERFARGEIDADEFQRRREILRGGTG